MRQKCSTRRFFFPTIIIFTISYYLEGIISHCGVFYETDLPRRRRARLDPRKQERIFDSAGRPRHRADTTAGSGHRGFGLVSATCNPQFWASASALCPLTVLMVWSSLEGPFSQMSVDWASGAQRCHSRGRAVADPLAGEAWLGGGVAYRYSASGCSADLAAAAAAAGPASSSGEERNSGLEVRGPAAGSHS